MTAKKFLEQAWQIEKCIDRKIEERSRLQEKLTAGRVSALTGMPRGGRDDWTDVADRVVELTGKINAEIVQLCEIKMQVNAAIDAVENVRHRRVLELRYRNYMTWEQIAAELGYELRWVYELHGRALTEVVVPEENAQREVRP